VVTNVSAPGVGSLLEGMQISSAVTQLVVQFNQPLSAVSAEDENNYLLLRAGGNGIQTQDCASGVSGSDVSISIDNASYDNLYTVTLDINGGTPLPAGTYRLLVCGTTSVFSLVGVELNGGWIDYDLLFLVSAQTSGGGGTGGGSSGTSGGALQLPSTGFAPNKTISLPPQPLEKIYSNTELMLEIPSLKVNTPIVGVLKSGDGWDVTWLGNSVGWLEGSAFPTWQGNTVLTAHVWNADNTPGVFAKIKDLKYGDRFYIHAYGQTYIYEVRENTWLSGARRVDKVFKHEKLDWVTLLTCEGYSPLTGNYLFRRMVRAVLMEVK
jgi:LPXTG-site transpeptidase (sortase) family protein